MTIAERPAGAEHRRTGSPLEVLLAFLKLGLTSFGGWQTYGGGGYWINPGAGNKNYWFAGWQLQRQITEQLALGGEIFHQTADSAGASDSTGFNLGGVFDITEHHHLLFSAGRGLENATESNEFSYYVAYQLTF